MRRRIKTCDVNSNCTIYFYHDTMGRVVEEYEKVGSGSVELKRSYVWGNGFDEIVGMFNPGTAASGDPNDMDDLDAFVTTWLLDANDVNFDNAYDDPNDDFIDYFDFATLSSGWTSTPKIPEKRWYYMKDALGSVMGLVGSHPNAHSEFYLYDVYGKPNGTSNVGNPYMYAGKRIDIYGNGQSQAHMENRDLNFYTGRLMSIDPLGVNPNGGIGNTWFDPRIQTIDGVNIYEYVSSNPVIYTDPTGLLRNPTNHVRSDWAGRAILWRYLSGGGNWSIYSRRWAEYMMRNQRLTSVVRSRVKREALLICRTGRLGRHSIGLQFHAEIENGESITGYNYFHGTNKLAGDFKIQGTANLVNRCCKIVFNLKYSWNDIINANPNYSTDTLKNLFAETITLGNAEAYTIKIIWNQGSIFERVGGVDLSRGWPFTNDYGPIIGPSTFKPLF